MKSWLFAIFLFCLGLCTPIFGENNPIRGIIMGSMVNLRETASLQASVLTVMPQGNLVVIQRTQGEWVKVQLVDGLEGWVYRKLISTDPMVINSRERFFTKIKRITGFALRYLGFKYVWGGATARGFDCSGFTMFIFAQCGWKLPHDAAAQMKLGTIIDQADLLPGDLVFFKALNTGKINHVGIYLGGGDFIHAASGFGAVRVSNLNSVYFKSRFYGARRLG